MENVEASENRHVDESIDRAVHAGAIIVTSKDHERGFIPPSLDINSKVEEYKPDLKSSEESHAIAASEPPQTTMAGPSRVGIPILNLQATCAQSVFL